ncbi:MAG: protein kinase [Planctomycetia bacterium]
MTHPPQLPDDLPDEPPAHSPTFPVGDGEPPGDTAPRDGPAELNDAELVRLAAIDDQLAGLASSSGDDEDPGGKITPEMAELLDTILLLRGVAAEEQIPSAERKFGKYRIVRKIGEGGFAEVYHVINTKLIRHEALKIARPEILVDPSKKRRFRREAKIASRVSHPNVVAIYEVGEHDRIPYIAEELCGESLHSWLTRHPGPVDPYVAAKLVRLLADAVHVAHTADVVHRDITPGNILLVPSADGVLPPDDRPLSHASEMAPQATLRQDVKLCDFGLGACDEVSDSGSDLPPLTVSGSQLGTPEWMSPEQIGTEFGTVDRRTDIHSLGLVLDRLLTGRSLNAGRSPTESFWRILQVDPEPANRIVPGIAADLVAVCLKCLAKRPDDRYPSAAELSVDLARFLDGRPTIARPLTPLQRLGRWTRRRPAIAIGIAATSLALILGVMVVSLLAQQKIVANEAALALAAAEATGHLRRAFESYRTGNGESVLAELKASISAEPALSHSLAGGWLLGRMHGEIASLLEGPAGSPLPASPPPAIHSIALQPGGRGMATGAADGTLSILPLTKDGIPAGKAIAVATGHEINHVAYSIDGSLVATADEDGRVSLWSAEDGHHVRDVADGGAPVFGIDFAPDGKRLAWAGADRTIRVAPIFAAMPGAGLIEMRPFDPPLSAIDSEDPDLEAIRFLDDHRLLVAVDFRVCLLRIPSGEIEREFAGTEGDVQSFALSGDGRRLLVSGWFEKMARVWDLATGELQLSLKHHPEWVKGCGFSPDGRRIVTGCKDGVVRIFDAASGRELHSIVGHVGRVWDVCFHPSGRILSAGGDGTVRLWEANGPWNLFGTHQIVLPISTVRSIQAIGGDEVVVLPQSGASLRIDTASQKITTSDEVHLSGTRHSVSSVDPSQRRIAFSSEDGKQIYRLPGMELFTTVDHAPGVALAWGPSGRFFSGIQEADGRSGSLLAHSLDLTSSETIEHYPESIAYLAVSAGSPPRLAVATGAKIRVYDLLADGSVAKKGKTLVDLSASGLIATVMAWSPDGDRLAFGTLGGQVWIVDGVSGSRIVEVSSFARAVRGIIWGNTGRTLIVADEECVRLCEAATGMMFDELRPDWAIEALTMVEGEGSGPRLAVIGNTFSAVGDALPSGRLLLFDLGRRLSDSGRDP